MKSIELEMKHWVCKVWLRGILSTFAMSPIILLLKSSCPIVSRVN